MFAPDEPKATPDYLKSLRKPLNRRNIDRIRKLLDHIDFCICMRSDDMVATRTWFRDVADEMSKCRAILHEEKRRRK